MGIWADAVDVLRPHVVKISTPRVSGTGFLISNGKSAPICGVATAAHVVDHAHFWEEPIRIDHVHSSKSVVIRRTNRAILLDENRDTAVIIFDRGEIPFPPEQMPLAPKDKYLRVGEKLGWLGFPAVSTANLCFFAGDISAWVNKDTYLVDGVAINGVSGGPAFSPNTSKGKTSVDLIGVVSAYVPNRATGEALPGLSVVRDVSQFHELAPTFKTLDAAKEAEPTPDKPPPPNPDEISPSKKA